MINIQQKFEDDIKGSIQTRDEGGTDPVEKLQGHQIKP